MPSAFPIRAEITGLKCPVLPASVGNCKISNVAFHSNSAPQPKSPDKRLTIRDVAVYQCQHWVCDAHGVIFEDITITDIRGGGPGAMGRSYLWGACVRMSELEVGFRVCCGAGRSIREMSKRVGAFSGQIWSGTEP